jgi:hypothetical protein
MQNKIFGSTKLQDIYGLNSAVKIMKSTGNVCRTECIETFCGKLEVTGRIISRLI